MRETFQVRNFAIAQNPILLSSMNGTIKNYTYLIHRLITLIFFLC
jgi:hypothetical protein